MIIESVDELKKLILEKGNVLSNKNEYHLAISKNNNLNIQYGGAGFDDDYNVYFYNSYIHLKYCVNKNKIYYMDEDCAWKVFPLKKDGTFKEGIVCVDEDMHSIREKYREMHLQDLKDEINEDIANYEKQIREKHRLIKETNECITVYLKRISDKKQLLSKLAN